MKKSIKWQGEALVCDRHPDGAHHYIVISKQKTNTAEHATELMCCHCLHRIGLHDVFETFPISD